MLHVHVLCFPLQEEIYCFVDFVDFLFLLPNLNQGVKTTKFLDLTYLVFKGQSFSKKYCPDRNSQFLKHTDFKYVP